jgi:hypothetical protein
MGGGDLLYFKDVKCPPKPIFCMIQYIQKDALRRINYLSVCLIIICRLHTSYDVFCGQEKRRSPQTPATEIYGRSPNRGKSKERQ